MEILLWLPAMLFGLFLLLRLVFNLALGAVRRKSQRIFDERFGGEAVLHQLDANFLGYEGKASIRGNGLLVLTGDQLQFLQFAPQREIALPLDQIQSVSLVRSYNGRMVGTPLLRVVARHGEALGWWVSDAESWRQRLSPQ